MRQTKFPRKTPTWQPATTRWHSGGSEWLTESFSSEEGFIVNFTCVTSKICSPGKKFSLFYFGDWLNVKENIAVELQLLESNYYSRMKQIVWEEQKGA